MARGRDNRMKTKLKKYITRSNFWGGWMPLTDEGNGSRPRLARSRRGEYRAVGGGVLCDFCFCLCVCTPRNCCNNRQKAWRLNNKLFFLNELSLYTIIHNTPDKTNPIILLLLLHISYIILQVVGHVRSTAARCSAACCCFVLNYHYL